MIGERPSFVHQYKYVSLILILILIAITGCLSADSGERYDDRNRVEIIVTSDVNTTNEVIVAVENSTGGEIYSGTYTVEPDEYISRDEIIMNSNKSASKPATIIAQMNDGEKYRWSYNPDQTNDCEAEDIEIWIGEEDLSLRYPC